MADLNQTVQNVLDRVRARSANSRAAYLAHVDAMATDSDGDRNQVSCSNLAHAAAAAGPDQDDVLVHLRHKNPISVSSAPIMICCQHTSLLKGFQLSSEARHAQLAVQHRLLAVFQPCVMASRKAGQVWNYHCSAVM